MRGVLVVFILLLQCTLNGCFMFQLRGRCIDYRRYAAKGNKKTTSKDGTIEMSRAKNGPRAGIEKAKKRTKGSNSLITPELSTTESLANPSSGQADNRPAQPQLSQIPPEIAFFGDPRNPPPASFASDTKYHGSLLYWARHATVAPRTSEDRLNRVFPKGRMHPSSGVHRLSNDVHTQVGAPKVLQNNVHADTKVARFLVQDASSDVNVSGSENISYDTILSSFIAVMDDLEASKAFIDSNMDIVPSALFLRALTADKLAAQSRGNIERMHYLKGVRNKYILAHDQLFFPLNIEVQKAETRVMTYLARPELATFASEWDSVEMTLHFATLLAARHTWDNRVREILTDIKKKVDASVGYMSQGLKKDLMDREFRKPAITSEVYLNASMSIQRDMRHLYEKVLPEVQLLHEVYFLNKEEEVVRYVREEFLPRFQLSEGQLKERLRLLEATLAAVQGVDYINLRLSMQSLYYMLCTDTEADSTDYWYTEFMERDTSHFVTYEPDTVPTILQYEQRLRDTGNAFANFAVEVLNLPTQYSNAFSGKRPKGAQVGNWLSLDPEFETPQPPTYEERVRQFQRAYMDQSELRKAAESQLDKAVVSRMNKQDAALGQGLYDSSGIADDVGSVFVYDGVDE